MIYIKGFGLLPYSCCCVGTSDIALCEDMPIKTNVNYPLPLGKIKRWHILAPPHNYYKSKSFNELSFISSVIPIYLNVMLGAE